MKYFRIAKHNFLIWCVDPKYFVAILYLVLYSYNRLHGMVEYARTLGTDLRPWLFPFLPGSSASFIPLMLAFVLLISDAPFKTAQQQFVLLRVGKQNWLCGQLLYLWIVSMGFVLGLWILSWLWLLPVMNWSSNWGEALTTGALTGAYAQFDVYIAIKYGVMKNAGPVEVTVWCMTVMTAVCYMFGTIMTACNLWLGKGWGATIVSTLVVLSSVPSAFAQEPGPLKILFWFSPVTWMDRSLMGKVGQKLPSYAYGIYAPLVIGLCLSLYLCATIYKCDLEMDKG